MSMKTYRNRCLFSEVCVNKRKPMYDWTDKPDQNVIIQDGKAPEQIGTGLVGDATRFIINNTTKLIENRERVGNFLKRADSLIFGEIGTSVNNALHSAFNSNPEFRPGFPFEKHALLETKHGLTRANFAGPKTQLEKRLKRGDIGVDGPNGIDNASRLHDIDYSQARNIQDIWKADDIYKKRIKRSTGGPKMKKFIVGAISAKQTAERSGLLSTQLISGIADDPIKRFVREGIKKKALKAIEKNLESQGLGLLPADRLMKSLRERRKS